MKFNYLYFLIIQLFFVSTIAQSSCYIMDLDLGKKDNKQHYFLYSSLILNEDNTFISTSLFDLQYSTCGIYEINNNIIELKQFKINYPTDTLNLMFCEEPDVIKNVMKIDFETEPYMNLKIKNDRLYLLNEKERVIKRIKENFVRTNIFADLFGKKYLFKKIDCDELNKIHQN